MTKISQEGGIEQPAHPKHGNHNYQQAFMHPEEKALKWNDPERDSWQHPQEIIAALALKPGATVVDIGAGTGYMVAPLSKIVGQDGMVIALDASEKMIEYLSRRKAELGPSQIVTKKVGHHDPELSTASVDGVMTLDTWHHMEGREAYSKLVYEGLKPGGRFVIVDYDLAAESGPPQEMRIAPERVQNELEAVGFRAEIFSETMPRHYLVVGYKD